MSNKKILAAFSGRFKGGAESVMIDLASMLESEGFEIKLLLNGKGEVFSLFKDRGAEFYRLDTDSYASLLWPFPYIKNLFKAACCLVSSGCSLVIVEGKVLTQILAPVSRLFNIPLITYVHFPPGEYEIKRVGYHLAVKIVLCCEGIKKYFVNHPRIQDSKIEIIPNYVDTKTFTPQPKSTKLREKLLGISRDEFALVLVGHLSKIKGQETLIESVKILRNKGCKVCAVLIGEDNDKQQSNLAALKQKTKALKLEKHVIFKGRQKQIPKLLAQCDLFVLPSLQEGLPLALLEAMACGLPVVASNVDGNADAVRDNETGFLIPQGDPVILAGKIESIVSGQHDVKKMGEAGRRRVLDLFTEERYRSGFMALIQSVIR